MAKQATNQRAADAESPRIHWRQRFEQWAANPTCEANSLAAVFGVSMAAVASAEGETVDRGQSPFAIARGESFEQRLFADHAERLTAALQRAEMLRADVAPAFHDFRLRQHRGPFAEPSAALNATAAFFRTFAESAGRLARPMIAASATISLPGAMVPDALLIPDVLLIRPTVSGAEILVGEIKAYPDRGGHTDPRQLATARAQAGVYVFGLRRALENFGIGGNVRVAGQGFLVLAAPGSNWPSVRRGEDFEYQAMRAERGFAKLEALKKNLVVPADADAKVRAVRDAVTDYRDVCAGFCARAGVCYRMAMADESAVILGDAAARLLGKISISRAIALMNRKAEPATAAEADFVRQIEQPEFSDA